MSVKDSFNNQQWLNDWNCTAIWDNHNPMIGEISNEFDFSLILIQIILAIHLIIRKVAAKLVPKLLTKMDLENMPLIFWICSIRNYG